MPKLIISLAILLAAIWLLLSGMWDHAILVPLGAASVALSVWLSHRLGVIDREGHPIHLLRASPRYLSWLLVEVIKANVHVARRILEPRLNISPRIVRLPITQQTDLGRTILANSITLTPGTVTIHVRGRELWFYALDEECAQSSLSGEMDRRAREFAGEKR
jgi:multicomponent Na+:H+ antiporter subunit E